jgi:hypothetical protein
MGLLVASRAPYVRLALALMSDAQRHLAAPLRRKLARSVAARESLPEALHSAKFGRLQLGVRYPAFEGLP